MKALYKTMIGIVLVVGAIAFSFKLQAIYRPKKKMKPLPIRVEVSVSIPEQWVAEMKKMHPKAVHEILRYIEA